MKRKVEFHKWTVAERNTLRKLVKASTPVEDIARGLGRSVRAVGQQMARIFNAIESITATCTSCKTEKPLSQFVKHLRSSTGHGSICRECKAEASRLYKHEVRAKMDRLRNLVEGDIEV